MNQEQFERMKNDKGFIAALDQSGGSTPKALKAYGLNEDAYASEAEMFDLVHTMRIRIMTDEAFTGEKILGAILFKETMERQVHGKDTADYLWEEKRIIPFLKVDSGLADQANGVQMMKPMPELNELLDRAIKKHIFGTKMRSVIHEINTEGIKAVVDQQFEVAKQILAKGLIPIIEPEVNIHAGEKAAIEAVLHNILLEHLNQLGEEQMVMLKLTLPETENLYADIVSHQNVLRVVALSGGYSKEDAVKRLSENKGVIASFSRALAEGLSVHQLDAEFHAALASSIKEIYSASLT